MESSNPIEKMRAKVAERLKQARNNPISESRLMELEQKLDLGKDEFIETQHRSPDRVKEENMIEKEILRSSALADNLTEYTEMLQQIRTAYGLTQEWANDLLAHENAHANVAQETGHEWVGYAAVFIKDSDGNLISIQPLHFTKPNLSWGPEEMIAKNIEVTKAPEVYVNKLSEGDELSLVEERRRLERIKMRKAPDEAKIEKLKIQLVAGCVEEK